MGKSKDADTVTGAEDELCDGCVEDVELSEEEATQDVELPPSRGGVEQPVPPKS